MHSSRSAVLIRSTSFIEFPKSPDGSIYYNANATLGFLGLQQLGVWYRRCKEPYPDFVLTSNLTDTNFYCNIPSSEICCTPTTETVLLEDGTTYTNLTSVTLTHPAYPEFSLIVNVSNPSQDFDHVLFYNA